MLTLLRINNGNFKSWTNPTETHMTYNSILKNTSEVIEAEHGLQGLQLFRHHCPIKSWDTYKMIKMISGAKR